MDRAAAEAWLGGERGEPQKRLAAPIIAALVAGYDAGHWTEDDVPNMDGPVPKSTSKLWMSVLVASAAEAKVTLNDVQRQRFENWIEISGPADGDVTSTSKSPSKRELEDLAEQSMSGTRELLHLELALFLGRASPESGIKGGSYGCTANEMEGAKLAFKQKRDTIETVITACRGESSLRKLDAFFGQLSTDLTKSEDPSIRNLSNRVLQMWQSVNRNLMSRVMAVLMYVEEYRVTYRGRGIPVIYDYEIGSRAMWSHASGGATLSGTGVDLSEIALPTGRRSAASDAASSIGSGSGSSLDSAQSTVIRGVQEKQSEMTKQMSDMMRGIQSLTEAVKSIKREDGESYYRDAKCKICGKTGHIARLCPDKAEKGEPSKKD